MSRVEEDPSCNEETARDCIENDSKLINSMNNMKNCQGKSIDENSEEKQENISIISYEDAKPPTKRIDYANKEEVKTFLDFSNKLKSSFDKTSSSKATINFNSSKRQKNEMNKQGYLSVKRNMTEESSICKIDESKICVESRSSHGHGCSNPNCLRKYKYSEDQINLHL